MAWVFTIVCIGGLAVKLYAETRYPMQKRIPKMVAATAFIAVALAVGALDTTFGRIMVVGLTLSWFGDLFLTYNGRTPFVAGLVSFLAGHVAYVIAFVNRGLDDGFYLLLVAVAVAAIPVTRWLMPTVPKELKGPVIAYIVIISLMVATAAATNTADADWRIPVGAWLSTSRTSSSPGTASLLPGSSTVIWDYPSISGDRSCSPGRPAVRSLLNNVSLASQQRL